MDYNTKDRLFFKDGLFLWRTELVPFLLLMAKNISMKTEPKLTETFANSNFSYITNYLYERSF